MNLELVSVQYSTLTTIDGKRIPRFLRKVYFEIPSGLDERKSSLIACLKNHCGAMPSLKVIHSSLTHTAYTLITQQAIDDGLYSKEKDTQFFVLRDSFDQLMKLDRQNKPYMYERFVNGTLCQISSTSYAIRIISLVPDISYPFSRINRNGNIKNTIEGDGSCLVFTKEGKPIPTKSFTIRYNQQSKRLKVGRFIIMNSFPLLY